MQERSEKDNSIACDLCDLQYHAKCLKLPSEVYRPTFLAKETDGAKLGLFQWLCSSCHGEAPRTLCLQQTNELIDVANAQNHKIENLEIQTTKLFSVIGASFDQPDLKFGHIQNRGDVKDSDSEKVNDSKPHNLIAHCSKAFADLLAI